MNQRLAVPVGPGVSRGSERTGPRFYPPDYPGALDATCRAQDPRDNRRRQLCARRCLLTVSEYLDDPLVDDRNGSSRILEPAGRRAGLPNEKEIGVDEAVDLQCAVVVNV